MSAGGGGFSCLHGQAPDRLVAHTQMVSSALKSTWDHKKHTFNLYLFLWMYSSTFLIPQPLCLSLCKSTVPTFYQVGDGLLIIPGPPYMRKIHSLSMILVAHIFSHCVTFGIHVACPIKQMHLLCYPFPLPPDGKIPKPFLALMLFSI